MVPRLNSCLVVDDLPANRAWHLTRLGNHQFNDTWVADHTCYGHNPDDTQPFFNLFPSKEEKRDSEQYRNAVPSSGGYRNAAGGLHHPMDPSYHRNTAAGEISASSATATPGHSTEWAEKVLSSFSHGVLDPSRHGNVFDKASNTASRFVIHDEELRKRLAKVG